MHSDILPNILTHLLASGMVITLVSGLIGAMLEALFPGPPVSTSARLLDIWFALSGKAISHFGAPFLVAMAGMISNARNIGLFQLSNTGFGLALSVAIYLISYDFLRYWIHRLEHAVPVLWAMHSFHHSSTELNTFTADRTYWLSALIHFCIIGPVMGFLFIAPPNVILVFLCILVALESISHTNIRLRLAPWAIWSSGRSSTGFTTRWSASTGTRISRSPSPPLISSSARLGRPANASGRKQGYLKSPGRLGCRQYCSGPCNSSGRDETTDGRRQSKARRSFRRTRPGRRPEPCRDPDDRGATFHSRAGRSAQPRP